MRQGRRRLRRVLIHRRADNDAGMRARVLTSLGLLIGAKIVNVQVPFLLKDAIDSLNIAVESGTIHTAVPIAAIIGCNFCFPSSHICNCLPVA